MNSFNKYVKYKTSGIEWIVEIPEKWEEKRFCYVFYFSKGLSITKENLQDEGIPCINYGEIHSKYGFEVNPEKNELKCVDEKYLLSSKKSLLNKGDFIFADTSEDIEGSGNFTCFTSNAVAFAGYHTIIVKTSQIINYRFIAYLFDSLPYRTQIRSEVTGIKVYSITKNILKNTIIILPPLPEQTAIATFLDDKTSKINTLIEKKERMIELLKEEKQAVINNAVTKGINKNVKLKDSGIDWIGEIPEHWKIKRLKYIAEIKFSSVDKKSYDEEIKILLCNYNEVYKNDYITNNLEFMEGTATQIEINKFKLYKDDVIVTKDSETPDDIAIPAYVKENLNNLICGYHLALLRTNKNELLGEYLFRLFQSSKFNANFQKSANGITRYGIGVDTFNDIMTTIPPLSEQTLIVSYIETETIRINKTIQLSKKEIVLLKEYRKALINEAVTGKIKVF